METELFLLVFGVVALGLLTSELAIETVRGRFGTLDRQRDYELHEMEATHDGIPRDAVMHRPARALGHTGRRRGLGGWGVLWLDEQRLGFVLQQPRRHSEILLGDVARVRTSHEFRRPGYRTVRSDQPILIVDWLTSRGAVTSGFSVEDAERWAREINQLREPKEIVTPRELSPHSVL